jgi:hypothetical protein
MLNKNIYLAQKKYYFGYKRHGAVGLDGNRGRNAFELGGGARSATS